MSETAKPRRWRRVRMAELQQIWADLQARDICYNGCTHHELMIKYKGHVKHIAGHGWYKLTTS